VATQGEVLKGRYELETRIGDGGMAEVFRACDRVSGEIVAVKRLRDDAGIPDARARFAREVELLASIDHPNCVRLLDANLETNAPFAVLELVTGADLRDLMRHPLPPEQVIVLSRQILHGLSALHARKIIHRDLKAENVMLTRDAEGREQAILVDLGAALPIGGDYRGPKVKRTAAGFILGTPVGISPEQLDGSPANERSDLYALGVLMFEMLTRRLPFTGDPTEILRQKIVGPDPRLPDSVPRMLAMAVHSLMHRDPMLRLGSTDAALRALECAEAELKRARRSHTWHDLLGKRFSSASRVRTAALSRLSPAYGSTRSSNSPRA
jgi:serine/threonine-protein kinase